MDYNQIDYNPLTFIKQSNQKQIEKLLYKASDKYYNEEDSIISDKSFDIIKDYLENNYPDSKFLKQIGAKIKSNDKVKNKVKLPVHMGSMNKKKKEKEIDSWIKKYPNEVVISDKLDGISFLLVIKYDKKKDTFSKQLLTRGNGTEGKDISHLLDLISFPKNISFKEDIIIRGEMLVTRENFQKMGDISANGRSFISGVSNLKEIKGKKLEYMKYIDLVCYELIKPEMKPSEQFKNLKDMRFKVVKNKIMKQINFANLKEYFLERKEKSKYDIDGIIITNNQINKRNIDGNPKYSFAFKMDLDFMITEVIKVEWNASKHGKLKPIVKIKKVNLCGTDNEAATGNNAGFIVTNKIGPGAIVKIIKGGEIIPKIEEVIKPSANGGQLPDSIEYEWNESHKEIILKNKEDNNDVKIKRLTIFFKTIGVEGIGPGTYKKLYQAGFNSIDKIALIKKEELIKLEGVKEKSADNIIKSLNLILQNEIDIKKIVVGSCIMGDGIGEKVLEKILNKYPNIFVEDIIVTEEELNDIPSIQTKTSNKFMSKLAEMRNFIKTNSYLKISENKESNISINDEDIINVVITGKRDPKIIDFIKENNGFNLQSVVNKNTNYIVTDNVEEETSKENPSSKIKKALELNKTIISNQDFISKYNI